MHEAAGIKGRALDRRRKREGVSIHDLPKAAETDLRRQLRDDVRVLCLSANRLHPLQWSHYGRAVGNRVGLIHKILILS
jgi:hypothetical protein